MGECMHNKGFTLIEVLIALAILSIALTAIIKATTQNIRDTHYIQTKTIANWVGMQVMNEALVGFVKLPEAPSHLDQETMMLGQNYEWQAELSETPNPHIKEIHVDVFEKTGHRHLIELVSYEYST